MRTRPLVALAALSVACLAATALAACTDDTPDDDPERSMNVAEARDALDEELHRSAAAVSGSGPPVLASDTGPTRCQSSQLGRVLDTVSVSLVLTVPVEPGRERDALDDVIAAWTDAGFEVDRSGIDRRDPQVLTKRDGFGMRALAVADSGQLALTGSTDCLEAAG